VQQPIDGIASQQLLSRQVQRHLRCGRSSHARNAKVCDSDPTANLLLGSSILRLPSDPTDHTV
jgi:hypothetical protein